MARIGALTMVVALAAAVSLPVVAEVPPVRDPFGDPTTRAVLPGCQELAEGRPVASPTAGFCSGMIDSLIYIGELLPEDFAYCVPLDMPRQWVIEAVVGEIAAVYPSVERQHFRGLVLEVLRYRWPCRPRSG